MKIAHKLLVALSLMVTSSVATARDISNDPSTEVSERSILRQGDYFISDAGKTMSPTYIHVNLTTQMMYVFNGDTLLGVSNISSGKDGFATPEGTFTILGKEDNHWSKKYKANMPWTMWVNNDGVALHAGVTPGVRSSHGCVHLPQSFSEQLFKVVQKGTVVEITQDDHIDQLAVSVFMNIR